MYAAIQNPSPTEITLSTQTGSVLIKLRRGDGEVHMRFGTPGDASQFFLDTAMMLAEAFKEHDDDQKVR